MTTLHRPVRLGALTLAHRLTGTAHASGIVSDGLPGAGDAEYWRRLAAGGAAMAVVGGTVVAPHSSNRSGNLTEAWRPEVVPGLAARAEAIAREGSVAACQLVHLGRETLGADIWHHPVAPSAVRSPRETTTPRALTGPEIDQVVEDFRLSAGHAVEAGFPVIELHAAHGYLLAQFLSPASNRRPDAGTAAGRAHVLRRIVSAIRESCPGAVIGARLSIEGDTEAGLSLAGLCETIPHLGVLDYLSVTVGVRSTYVRDMAVESPPLLGSIARLRAATSLPLVIGQAFRTPRQMARAVEEGADLIGMARPLIADPDLPRKVLADRSHDVRPCVSCNEDCRAFVPVLLCTVNPDLAPPGRYSRPAQPLALGPTRRGTRSRVAVVGAGPAGLECALRLGATHDVTLLETSDRIGGHLAMASDAPHRHGWRALLEHYSAQLMDSGVTIRLGCTATRADLSDVDDIVIATGAMEGASDFPAARRATDLLSSAAAVVPTHHRVLIVDQGSGDWLTASAIEKVLADGASLVTVATPSAAYLAGLPPEGRVQLLARTASAPVEVFVMTTLESFDGITAILHRGANRSSVILPVDDVIVAGLRTSLPWQELVPDGTPLQVIGDALVPRKVAHAIAEGAGAARAILARA